MKYGPEPPISSSQMSLPSAVASMPDNVAAQPPKALPGTLSES